jgi:hypothetical protein
MGLMLVVLVSGNGNVKVLRNKNLIQLSLHLIEILLKEMMVILILMPLLLPLK